MAADGAVAVDAGVASLDTTLRFESVAALVETLRPGRPILCVRPHVIVEAARRFRSTFPGTVLYAMKCNPHPLVMRALWAGGIRDFDVASLAEIEQVRGSFPGARACFMHPVKSREAIRAAHHVHGVRHFVVDHADEFEKVLAETGGRDFVLFVRVKTPEVSKALYHLAGKFGAGPVEAAELVRESVKRGCRTGLTFHVGSQCLAPSAYRRALDLVGEVVERSGERPACIDVGGGFPEAYPGVEAPPLEVYVRRIRAALRRLGLGGTELWAEPGRALVASGCSLLTQIQLRKDDELYLNDGVYGAFSELIDSEQELPARVFPGDGRGRGEEPRDFVVYGPTCDSMDTLASTLRLPGDVAEGDWVEIDQIGAYSNALATRFNGFSLDTFAELGDVPLSRLAPGGPAPEDVSVDSS